ncbi:MAG: SGNH/GDSL hydrolase family protein [Actinomycetota bacterium]
MRSLATFVAAVSAVAAVATSVPAHAAAADADVADGFDRVITLGDSFSSGSGIHADATDYDDHGPERHYFAEHTRLGGSGCQRELDSTPGPRLADELDASFDMVACAGARIEHVPNQLAAASIDDRGAGTLISLTIGGNDLRTHRGEVWPDVILRCITSGGCNESDQNQPANLDEIESDLARLYTVAGWRFRDATIRVLAYPRLMQRDRWGCAGVTGMNRHEAKWIDDQVDELNARIESAVDRASAVSRADIEFVPVVDEFDNHGSCRFWQRDRYVNDAVFGATFTRSMTADGDVREHVNDGLLTISGASFHPSQKGYDAYLDALRASI